MNELETTTKTALSVPDFGSLFLDYLHFLGAKKKSERTLDTYRKSIKQFFVFCRSRRETRPTEGTVLDYMNFLNAQGKTASTMRIYLSTVRTFFKFLSKRGIYEDITESLDAPKADRGSYSKGYLSDENELQILELSRSSRRDYAILFLMLTTGLRVSEVVSAKVSDLKEVFGETRLYVKGKGRGSKSDFVKVAPDVLPILRDYLGTRKDGPLFLSESNRNLDQALTPRSLSRLIKNYLRKAGLDSPTLTAHSLRHTTAVQNLLNGGTLEETRELLRHRDSRTTEIYSHEIERLRNHSENRLASALVSKIQGAGSLKVA